MKEDGGPAFPAISTGSNYTNGGMTLRDYFAAAALQGHCASTNILEHAMNSEECDLAWRNAAAFSYRCADEMLNERDR